MCEDYTSYLLGVSNDLKKPYLTDVIAYHFPNETHVYVIMSIYNVPVDRRAEEIHQNYSLIFDGVTYNTLLPVNSSYPYHSIMKYILPFPFNIRNGIKVEPFYGSFVVTIVNKVQHRVYSNVHVCLRNRIVRRNTTLCAYVSDYNSMDELRHWSAYHLMMHIDKLVFYMGNNYFDLDRMMKNITELGFLEIVNWVFPKNVLEDGQPIQINHQYAQAASCFYRNKYASRYVLLFDTDEYMYINKTHVEYDLLPYIELWNSEYPSVDAFRVKSNMMMRKRETWVPRDKYIREGKLFTFFNRILPEIYSGRIKLILPSRFDGIMGLHDCTSCSMFIPPDDILRMAHYKVTYMRAHDVDNVMKLYAEPVLNMRRELFGE